MTTEQIWLLALAVVLLIGTVVLGERCIAPLRRRVKSEENIVRAMAKEWVRQRREDSSRKV